MSNNLTISASPHIHSGRSTWRIMLDVIISLLPATVAGCIIFGMRALLVVALTVACSVGFEALFNLITKRKQTLGDLSAVVTGLLLSLNLPATVPLWQCVIGALFAIVVVKCLFGGLGCNPVNPAITARVFMLVSFGSMAKAAFPTVVDTVAGATPLASGGTTSLTDLLLGLHGGSIGETCAIALLAGFIYLLVRRVISWHLPVTFVGTVFVLTLCFGGFDFQAALAAVLSGGLLIGAIFMATDYVTSPSTAWGKVIFGVGAGLITFVIRYAYVKSGTGITEGVSYAILLMNIITPFIDSWTRHKVFGTGGKKA